MGKIENVIKRTGVIVPFKPERITNAIYRAAIAVGGRDRDIAEHLSRKVVRILEEQTPPGHLPYIEEIQDIVERVLIHEGHAKVAKAYILYRDERTRRRKEHDALVSRASKNIPWAKNWHILDWAVDHGVNTVWGLNQRIEKGEFSDIVQESETAYSEDLENASEQIMERVKGLKIVIITGPSSSGKTTTTTKLSQKLTTTGMHFRLMNLDNYFFNLEQHPKDEFGDYDFETPQALDLALINEHLKRLLDGDEVLLPSYNFKVGIRTNDQILMKLDPGEVLLIDSLHGLYPTMTEGIPDEYKFKLYLEPLLQMKGPNGEYIHWADLRLIRRMLRDEIHRAYDPYRTLVHWHYVRSSEMHNIIPNINQADYIINTAMPYEVAIYREKLKLKFIKWEKTFKNDPLHQDAYKRIARILLWMNAVQPVDDESAIPQDSVIREFIGGSIFNY